MDYVLDLYVKHGYIVDVLDENGKTLEFDLAGFSEKIPDFEIYGNIGKNEEEDEPFFVLNNQGYRVPLRPEELMISMELKDGYEVLVKKKACLDEYGYSYAGGPSIGVELLKWELWRKMDDGHLKKMEVSMTGVGPEQRREED